MKAFIRIFEALIASLVLLSFLTYFLLPSIYSKWGDAMLHINVEDSLAVIYKNGSVTEFIKRNDNENLTNLLRKTVSKNVDFSIEIAGIAKPYIRIGCVCNSSEKNKLDEILSPKIFYYNNRRIEILTENGSLDDMMDSDILFFFGYRSFSESEKIKLMNFLGMDKSIFILSDLNNEQINDAFMNEIFGLKSSSQAEPSAVSKFYDSNNASKVSFRIARYFSWIGGNVDSEFRFNKQRDFNNVMIDDKTIIKAPPGADKFSLVKVNYGMINGSGRTVWSSNYSYTDNNINNLTKALIMWASGERLNMDTYAKNIPTAKTFFKYRYFGLLDNEPFEIDLTVWKIFY